MFSVSENQCLGIGKPVLSVSENQCCRYQRISVVSQIRSTSVDSIVKLVLSESENQR